nr:hypothetical protein [Tanacetum cinerariifolium]
FKQKEDGDLFLVDKLWMEIEDREKKIERIIQLIFKKGHQDIAPVVSELAVAYADWWPPLVNWWVWIDLMSNKLRLKCVRLADEIGAGMGVVGW